MTPVKKVHQCCTSASECWFPCITPATLWKKNSWYLSNLQQSSCHWTGVQPDVLFYSCPSSSSRFKVFEKCFFSIHQGCKEWSSYHRLLVSSNQSNHSPLMSLIKAFHPTKLLLTGCVLLSTMCKLRRLLCMKILRFLYQNYSNQPIVHQQIYRQCHWWEK